VTYHAQLAYERALHDGEPVPLAKKKQTPFNRYLCNMGREGLTNERVIP
jgi:hypothetical protein